MTAGPLFIFGAMSPYSWFAAERIGALIPDAEWRPVFAGGLFKSVGRVSWGITDRRAEKIADCEARAAEHGLGPIVWPEPWPTNDVRIARAMVHAAQRGQLQEFALTAMRMCFLEGAELGDPAVVEAVGVRAGFEPGEITAAIEDPAVKAAIHAANDEALALGVIGVPTVAAGGELYWGDDRLADAARAVFAG